MSCSLSSGARTVELLVVSLSTALNSSSSTIHAQNANWFKAWQPAQDAMSLTFRQASPVDQKDTFDVLSSWCQNLQILTLSYPERNINMKCVIDSISDKQSYSHTMLDLTVNLRLLTNSFIDDIAGFKYSDLAKTLFDSDYVKEEDVDLGAGPGIPKTEYTLSELNANGHGYVITPADGSYVIVSNSELWNGKSYRVRLTTDLAQHIIDGDDFQAWAAANNDK